MSEQFVEDQARRQIMKCSSAPNAGYVGFAYRESQFWFREDTLYSASSHPTTNHTKKAAPNAAWLPGRNALSRLCGHSARLEPSGYELLGQRGRKKVAPPNMGAACL